MPCSPVTKACSSAGGAASSRSRAAGPTSDRSARDGGHVLELHVAAERVGPRACARAPRGRSPPCRARTSRRRAGRAGRCAASPCGSGRWRSSRCPGSSASTSFDTWPWRKSAASEPRTRNFARLRAVDKPDRFRHELVVAGGDHATSVLLGKANHEDSGKANFPGGGCWAVRRRHRAALPVLHELVPHQRPARRSTPPPRRHGAAHAPAARTRRSPPGRGGHGRPAHERLRPAGDPARLRRGPRGGRRARVGARRRGEGDRGGARREVRRLGVQRARAGPDAPRPRGRAAADPLHERLEAPAHDPLPRHPHRAAWTAWPGIGAGNIAPGKSTTYEFDATPVRPAPLPLPHDAARRAHREGPLRRVHHRPEGRAARRPTSS